LAFLAFGCPSTVTGTAVIYFLCFVLFFALRAKKRTTDEMGSTMLPRKSCNLRD
jgi:hypothetical protein